MTKRSKKQIELDEKKVIKQLLQNSNESINAIAKKCGFSRQKVWRIIKRLEKDNTIWGYPAVVDDEKLGVESFVIIIKRTPLPMTKQTIKSIVNRELQKAANKINIQIDGSFYLNGAYDWMICFTADNIRQAKKFAEIVNIKFQGQISEVLLLEKLFTTNKAGIPNPNITELEKFFEDI